MRWHCSAAMHELFNDIRHAVILFALLSKSYNYSSSWEWWKIFKSELLTLKASWLETFSMIASPALDSLMLKVVKEQSISPPLKFHLKRDKIVNMCDFKEHCKFVFILKLINCPFWEQRESRNCRTSTL